MSFQRHVPSSTAEVEEYLRQLRNGPEYISSIKLNEDEARLEIRFNRGPSLISYPDTYVPIRRDRLKEAAPLVEKLLTGASRNTRPSKEDVEAFFDVVDRQ